MLITCLLRTIVLGLCNFFINFSQKSATNKNPVRKTPRKKSYRQDVVVVRYILKWGFFLYFTPDKPDNL